MCAGNHLSTVCAGNLHGLIWADYHRFYVERRFTIHTDPVRIPVGGEGNMRAICVDSLHGLIWFG